MFKVSDLTLGLTLPIKKLDFNWNKLDYTTIPWFLLVSHIISMFLPIQAIVCHGTMGRLLRPMIGTMTRTSITTTARTAPSLSMEPGGIQAATTQTWTGITRILHLAKASTGITSPATTSHWPRWRWNWGGREIYLWLTWPMCNGYNYRDDV